MTHDNTWPGVWLPAATLAAITEMVGGCELAAESTHIKPTGTVLSKLEGNVRGESASSSSLRPGFISASSIPATFSGTLAGGTAVSGAQARRLTSFCTSPSRHL